MLTPLKKQFPVKEPQPTQEEIAKLAYELYLKRGCTHGQDREDWLQAEEALKRACCGEDERCRTGAIRMN